MLSLVHSPLLLQVVLIFTKDQLYYNYVFQNDKKPILDLFINPNRKAELVKYQTVMARPIKDYIQAMTKESFDKVNI